MFSRLSKFVCPKRTPYSMLLINKRNKHTKIIPRGKGNMYAFIFIMSVISGTSFFL